MVQRTINPTAMKYLITLLCSILFLTISHAQNDQEQVKERIPTRPHYDGSWLIDNESAGISIREDEPVHGP